MAIKAGQLKERADYQAYILEMLREENGYQVRPSTAYDPGYGMDVERLFSFLEATQRRFCLSARKARISNPLSMGRILYLLG